ASEGGSFAHEPDETQLVFEQLKRSRRTGAHAFTTRPFLPGFNGGLFLPERRSRGHTSEGGSAPVGFRPATAANARLCFEDLIPTDAASDLTCGDSLAGHPLKVLRQRRSNHPSGACAEPPRLAWTFESCCSGTRPPSPKGPAFDRFS
ncbi:unnamed protein product, partial [Durusdinium trenchii]